MSALAMDIKNEWRCLSSQEFEKDLLNAMRKSGWDGSENPEQLNWTFTGSLFYSIIVITTIGNFYNCSEQKYSQNYFF